MNIQEAIDYTNELLENPYSDEEKIRWLSNLEGHLYRMIFENYEGEEEFEPYDSVTPRYTELRAEIPFDRIYTEWLISQIHLHNKDISLYNNAAERYATILDEYSKYYRRTHQLKHKTKFINYKV